MHHAELDIRQGGERDMAQQNNLSIVRSHMVEPENKSVVSNYSCVSNMSNLEIQQANKILILQFLQKGFSITSEEIILIQKTDPSIKKMHKESKDGTYEEYRGIVFHKNRECV